MRFPTMCYVRPTKPQISLRIRLKGGCAGSSKSSLVKIPQCSESHVAAHMESIISKRATCKKIVFYLVSVAVQAGLNMSHTPKTGFLATRPLNISNIPRISKQLNQIDQITMSIV